MYVRDTVCRGTGYHDQPGTPMTQRWRQVTFVGAEPKEKVWASRAMRKLCPKGWKRIRINSRYNSYVRFTCYDETAFTRINDAWIEEMWLKLLLIQE